MLITDAQLIDAYSQMGFVQVPDEFHLVFRRSDLIMFHQSIDGKLELAFVLEDARNWDPEIAQQLETILI